MKLLGTRIYAECIEAKDQTSSGIYVSKADILENNRAIVKFVGPRVRFFKPGDTLQYNKNTATKYDHEGKEGVFVKEDLNELFKV